ncbi:MAG: 30S ribosomal protein S20 [candidate division Zixibacteria bacterium]|nr:30S ribosomal protein S20 [candidate division Zixibacteria bacterium]
MARKLSAKKRNRQSIVHNRRNRAAKSKIRSTVKQYESAAPETKVEGLRAVASVVDKAAVKRVIHRNKANRTKSRMAKKLNKAEASKG